jgi:enoyl-CoA hydratase
MFDPDGALAAGLLDVVVPPDELEPAALAAAADLATLDQRAHAATKLRVRHDIARDLRAAVESELTVAGSTVTA